MARLFEAVFLSALGVCIYGCAGAGMMAAAGWPASSRLAAEAWMGEWPGGYWFWIQFGVALVLFVGWLVSVTWFEWRSGW